MYHSFFSYSVSKPYPFRWFTPVTIAGGMIFATLFSLVNLATQGYQLRTIFTNDPNTSLSTRQKWFMERPFNWGDGLKPICQPLLLSVGSQVFTTNLGFNYEVVAVTRYDAATKRAIPIGSVPYLNSTLRDCRTNEVYITLTRADRSVPPSWWISWSRSDTRSRVQCTVDAASGPANITLETTFSGSGEDKSEDDFPFVITDNYTTHASMWWGTRLMTSYWNGIMSVMSISFTEYNLVTSGGMGFNWNDSNSKNIRDLDFFSFGYHVLFDDSKVFNDASKGVLLLNNDSEPASRLLTQGLFWSKIMHSALMVDLGNTEAPSFLTNAEDLKYLLSGEGDMVRKQPGINLTVNGHEAFGRDIYARIQPPGMAYTATSRVLIPDSYASFGDRMGPLGTKEATIYSQYACSVPFQRSTGVMIWGILLANLVFLQAAWKVLNLIAETIVTKKQPTAMYCNGCTNGAYQMDSIQEGSSRVPDREAILSLGQSESTQRLIDS